MTFAQRRISQNVSPSLGDAYLYIGSSEFETSHSVAWRILFVVMYMTTD